LGENEERNIPTVIHNVRTFVHIELGICHNTIQIHTCSSAVLRATALGIWWRSTTIGFFMKSAIAWVKSHAPIFVM
jgi:hypothetical protein